MSTENKKILTSFQEQTTQLNRRIAAWNLRVPAPGFQRKMIDAERKIRKMQEE